MNDSIDVEYSKLEELFAQKVITSPEVENKGVQRRQISTEVKKIKG